MGYAQWVVFHIVNRDPFHTLVIKDVETMCGKIHANGDKNKEIGTPAVEGREIPPGGEFTFSSCGRESALYGTEGRFNLYEKDANKLVCRCYWDCPLGSPTNTWTMSDFDSRWVVQSEGASLTNALGNITIKATTGA